MKSENYRVVIADDETMMKKTSSFAIRSLAAGAACALALSSSHAQTAQKAPDNPAFLQYQQPRAQQAAAIRTVDGHRLGYAPSPVDRSHLRGRQAIRTRAFRSLPASYDLRTLSKLTPVKDQGNYGTCWTFASYGSLESWLLPTETRDFSENNLANTHGFDWGYDDGGNASISCAYLARWSGPINESDDPYSNGPANSPSNLPVQKHVQQAMIIPLKANALDNTAIKEAVLNYGAMYVSMYIDNSHYSNTYASFYYDGTNDANHAVAIVGWNDTYPSNQFRHVAPGNGAFIVRNSWGTDWGEQGYFYCSYYDSIMGYNENIAFNNAESTTNYGSIYQYDPLGWVTSYGYNDTNAWAANIFTATSSDPLGAVSFYANDINLGYEIHVYRDVTPNQPRSGTLAASQTGTLAYPGYYTLALNSPVTVSSGQLFSVVIRFITSSYGYPIPMEYALSNYSSQATASPGQSFYSHAGASWSDLTADEPTGNFCIKAFAGTGTEPPAPVMGPVAPGVVGDYDGDEKNDPAIYQESSGRWILLLSANGFARLDLADGYLGAAGYRGITADYDGDGKADPAVYHQTNGYWLIKLSASGYGIATVSAFGGAGYTPLVADFDGDGKADPAIVNNSSGNWAVKLSGNSYLIATLSGFGGTNYTPLAADYDGDRKADPAIYHASTGGWFVKLSASGYGAATITGLGGASYDAFTADFDGDSKADPAVQDPTAGTWLIKLSASGYSIGTLSGFGGAGYGNAFAADYDGDGQADPGLYQSSTGTWYFRLSASGYNQATGSSGYTP